MRRERSAARFTAVSRCVQGAAVAGRARRSLTSEQIELFSFGEPINPWKWFSLNSC